eukprot:2521270-Alexandrium_andersonii.AAC.1
MGLCGGGLAPLLGDSAIGRRPSHRLKPSCTALTNMLVRRLSGAVQWRLAKCPPEPSGGRLPANAVLSAINAEAVSGPR